LVTTASQKVASVPAQSLELLQVLPSPSGGLTQTLGDAFKAHAYPLVQSVLLIHGTA
jgi:hypothetical protein